MPAKIVIQPEAMPVSLADARSHARVNGSDMDSDIEICVRALTAEAEHLTGRVIINRTYRVTLPGFPERIILPATPVYEVLSIEYFDIDGVERALPEDSYIVDADSVRGSITPAPETSWPATQVRSNAVTVMVVCGYGTDDSSTPAAFKGYILAKVKEAFAPAGTPESPHLIRLLDSLKVY